MNLFFYQVLLIVYLTTLHCPYNTLLLFVFISFRHCGMQMRPCNMKALLAMLIPYWIPHTSSHGRFLFQMCDKLSGFLLK